MGGMQMEQNMEYLLGLDESERVAFMTILARLARADGKMSKEEKNFISEMARVYNISEENIKEIIYNHTDDEIIDYAKKISSRKTALELIKEMCILAHADDELSDSEIELIVKVGSVMAVDMEKIEKISNWIIQRLIWEDEGKIIFEEVL